MKEILYSPGFGAGFATWNDNSKELAEDPELIKLVEKGEHKGFTTWQELKEAGLNYVKGFDEEASIAFIKRAQEVNEGRHVYFGGVAQLEVTWVSGKYRIDHYDGSESVRTENDKEDWW